MADRRKLQAEVDRCLKKVQEGVDAFEDIWQKVQSANNLNQKEKYEADLKKEIKKLQRLREQIKTWASSSDIKDKQILLENRKLIETQMERFKVVEKETKTKAYSKEGLGAGRRLDPMEKEREEVRQWLQDCIEKLGLQSEKLDSELEVLRNAKKKKGDKNDKVDAVKMQLLRHGHHVKSLEAILRLLTNESIEVEQVKNVQQDVDYYVDCNQDPDFEENEYIYDEFDLESAESFLQKPADEDDEDAENLDRPAEALSTNSHPIHLAADSTVSVSNHSGSASSSTPGTNAVRDKDPPDGRKRQKSVSEEQQQTAWKNAQLTNSGAASQPSLAAAASVLSSDSPTAQHHSVNLRLNAGPVPAGPSSTRSSSAASAAATTSDMTPLTPPVTTVSGFAAAVAASLPPTTVAPSVQHNSYSNAVSTVAGPVSGAVQPESVPGSGVAKGPRAAQQAATNSGSSSAQQQQMQQKNQSAELVVRAAEDKEALPPSLATATAGVAPSAAVVPPPSSTPSSLPSSGGSSASSVNNSAMPSPAPSPAAAPLPPLAATVQPGATASLLPPAPSTEGSGKLPDASSAAVAYQNGLVHATSAAIAKVLSSTDSIHSLRTAALEAAAAISLPNSNMFNSSSSTAGNQLSLVPSQSPAADVGHPPSVPSPSESEITVHYQTSTIRISPLLGIAPLGQQMLTKENTYQLNMVSAAFEHMPHPSDSERIRHYIPRNPCSTPAYYPQALAPQADSVEYFQRLSTETLFFVFYYMEGTKAQYLAAKALKKQSWRFHTKYLMWFQRHDEPKTITDEYEQGTYIYFDYEKWGQRRKDGFTFEYRYLEDKEL